MTALRLPVPRAFRLAAVPVAVLVLGAAALTGCGGGSGSPAKKTDAEAQVREVVRRYGVAVARKDYQQICDRLLAPSVSEQAEQVGLPCEIAFKKGLEDVSGATLRIDGVRVQAGKTAFVKIHTTATGQPPSDDTMELARTGGRWRITAVGGAKDPAAAKPGTTPTGSTTTGTTPDDDK